jgi:hypothetical protein
VSKSGADRTHGPLLDLLSEMLAVERDGQRLYEGFLQDAPAGLQPKLLEYAEQTRRSVLALEKAIAEIGGDPAHVSPGAVVAHRLTDAVLEATEDSPVRRWMYRLLHVVAFEIRDELVWDTLRVIVTQDPDRAEAESLERAVMATQSDEALGAHGQDRRQERIAWARHAMRSAILDELGVEEQAVWRTRLRHALRGW